MLLNDLVGDITPSPEHLASFVKAWFAPTDYVSLVAIPSQEFKTQNKRNKVLSQAVLVTELVAATADDLRGLVMAPGIEYNMYLGINPLNKENKVSLHARGDETEIREIYGVFIDFDIKPGCFSNKQDIHKFLDKFSKEVIAPTIVVDNGKYGGVHAYWRFDLKENEHVMGDQARTLLQNWWSLIAEHASLWEEGVDIDRLIDLTRVSRMPGGIYWPSKSLGSTEVPVPDLIRVISLDERYPVEVISHLCNGAGDRYREKIKTFRKRENDRIINTDQIIRDVLNVKAGERLGNHWGALAAIAYIEDIFNDLYSWEDILIPAGWTFLYTDREDRQIVARPGRHEKSATVGWTESPHMMSLLSSSPDTGLADLKEIGAPLSKYRVAQRLLWNDDEKKMVDDILKSVFKESDI
jgi:hypothetical protein